MTDLVIAEYEDIANVADAIRSKTGITDTMTLSEMASNVSNIIGDGVMLDTALSETSTNPVQNKVVTEEFRRLSEELDSKFEYVYTRNMYHCEKLNEGMYLGTNGAVSENSNMAYVDNYFDVDESTDYVASRYDLDGSYITGGNFIVTFYDSSKTFLSYKQLIDENVGKFETPLNCKFIRLSGSLKWFTSELIQLEKGTTPTNYIEYKKTSMLLEECIPEIVNLKTVINHITVKKNGTGNYTNVQKAINSIENNSKENQYIIHVYDGEYNLGEDFTESDLENTSFSGIFVPDFTTIKGEGNRDNIILFVELEESNNMISALNLSNTSSLENLTIKGIKTRYCIHDDFAKNNISYERRVKNCKFVAIHTYYNACYGSGCREGADWIFENCIFDASQCNDSNGKIAFLNHNNTKWEYTSSIKFINCKFIGRYVKNYNGVITLRTLNNNANGMETNISLYGCDVGGGMVLKEESQESYGSGILFRVNGFCNKNLEYSIVNTDEKDYSTNIEIIN